MTIHYADRLDDAIRRKGTPALVGIDPRLDLLPAEVLERAQQAGGDRDQVAAAAFEEFCFRLIDVVAPLVPAVKPQAAFFEQYGPAGVAVLGRVIRQARKAGLLVICDGKRGDIGSTAEAYASAYLAGADPDAAPFAADALTVNPYLGADTLEPFVETAATRGGGLYVLVRTSNPGAGTFQDLLADGQPVYRHAARMVQELARSSMGDGGYGAIGAVVGATYPRELAELREAMPEVPLLVPGYGSQGAGAGDVAAAFGPDGLGALVNSSRGINFAYRREPFEQEFGEPRWEEAVKAATRQMIADLAGSTPAGDL
ncbi:MAG: orotidine-5'-phosphate decarboxylase [Planctomycetota bacterium]|nr:orotidine-5'-phosphate decarboxylase [Planctomycetota bacterium]